MQVGHGNDSWNERQARCLGTIARAIGLRPRPAVRGLGEVSVVVRSSPPCMPGVLPACLEELVRAFVPVEDSVVDNDCLAVGSSRGPEVAGQRHILELCREGRKVSVEREVRPTEIA